jgi:hypothetical protein
MPHGRLTSGQLLEAQAWWDDATRIDIRVLLSIDDATFKEAITVRLI